MPRGEAALAAAPAAARHRHQYARAEWERRFLLAAPPPAGAAVAERSIADRYLTGTRLRLRCITWPLTGQRELKLTQKVPASTSGRAPSMITSMYLSPAEYELLSRLPADTLAKRRLTVPPYVIDVFGPPLLGLVLAEAEFDTAAELAACPPPAGAVAEVTADPRFTGGRLAVTRRAELLGWLAGQGVAAASDQAGLQR